MLNSGGSKKIKKNKKFNMKMIKYKILNIKLKFLIKIKK